MPALLLMAMVAVLDQIGNGCDDARAAVAAPPLFDVLLRACPSTSSHTRPQLHEDDGAFVAVERTNGRGWCNIRRGGQEQTIYSDCVPSTVGDVDVKGLEDQRFQCPVWREGDCGAGAGEGERGRAASRARV